MTRFAAFIWLGVFGCGFASPAGHAASAQEATAKAGDTKGGQPKRVEKTDAEWAKLLPRNSYLVTRRKMTEPAGSGKYAHYKGKGIFACICCGTELFDAKTKFESGTGWPSFYAPIANDRIATAEDHEMAEPRIEVMCAVCDAHLGHVFDDGPPPTGLRYCMNSVALTLVKPAASEPNAKAKTKANAEKKTDPAKPGGETKKKAN
jgi:peptide-methionine (R)-S-oxide reductase